jgi:hypothetical protein
METKDASAIAGVSFQQTALWLGVSALLFAIPFGVMRAGSLGWGGLFAVVWLLFLVGAVLAGVQAVTNGSVVLAWLLPLAPYLGLKTILGSPAPSPAGGLVVALFFGSTAFLAGDEIASRVDSLAPSLERRERLVVVAVLVITGSLFTVYYVAPIWSG